MSLQEDFLKSNILSWRRNTNNSNRIEILLENPLPFTPTNYNLGDPKSRIVDTKLAYYHIDYYGFLVNYYLKSQSSTYRSSDTVFNQMTNETIKDVWINNVRWGIEASILDMILQEAKDKEFTVHPRCPCCEDSVDYEELIRKGMCAHCQYKAFMCTVFYECSPTQKIYIAKDAWYQTKDHMVRTNSHVVVRDTYGKNPKREVLYGHINKGEKLIEVIF